jgi:replicative DNA helicase
MTPEVQLEQVIIGACLLEDESALELACTCLEPHHFLLDSNQRVFRHIARMHKQGSSVNTVTLLQELGAELDAVGGYAWVSDLTTGVPRRMGERLKEYAERLKEQWRRRRIAGLGEEMAQEATMGQETSASLIQGATTRLEAIAADSETEDATVGASIVAFMDSLAIRRQRKVSPGLSYGLAELDEHTDGMMPGEQTAVGAVSGVGKTAFMCQSIFGALMKGHAVDAFLLEPTKEQVMARLISLYMNIRYEALIKPWKMRVDEERDAQSGANWLAEMPLRMFARSTMTLDEVIGQARIGMHKHETRLICLDYIQRLKVRETEKGESVRLRVGRASTALADLVKNTQTHSMVLSQITTGRKAGASSMPTMFDFRESSQIENDAHTIVLLHREFDETQNHYTNQGAIFVPKQRNGTPCNLKVSFDPTTAAWADIQTKERLYA